MKQRVYIETSVISYLTARPSRDVMQLARQVATEQWWRHHRAKCDVFVSEVVILEAGQGDDDARQRRLDAISGVSILAATPEVAKLTQMFMKGHALPSRAEYDAAHIALAAVHKMDILLTWNLRHIANVIAGPRIRAIIEAAGYVAPTITTPEDLLGSMGEVP